MSRFKEVIWDFDGVILMSDAVREYGFREIFKNYSPELVEQLLKFHFENGGLSRYVKIQYFYEKVLNEPITQAKIDTLAEEFSSIMKAMLVNEQLINQEWLELIDLLEGRFIHSIASGSDGKELNYLCDQLGLSMYFKSIKGSPARKKDLVREIMNKSDNPPSAFVLIGDAVNDWEAAGENEIFFIGYRNPLLKESPLYVDDLRDLAKFLCS